MFEGLDWWVASFTDAWIETEAVKYDYSYVVVASFTDAWIETHISATPKRNTRVASFTDAWIETKHTKACMNTETMSHLLQMRGLKHTAHSQAV